MAKKEFRGLATNGKGKGPIVGYNNKKWYANFDKINWHRKDLHLNSKDEQNEPIPRTTENI